MCPGGRTAFFWFWRKEPEVKKTLKEQLEGPEMPLVSYSEQGLAWKIYERLWRFAKGQLADSELEEFLLEKLESAEENLTVLETIDYPEIAAEHHEHLHAAFVSFLQALELLEEFLWGEAEELVQEDGSELTLGAVMRKILEADRALLGFEGGMAAECDSVASLGKTW